MCLKSWMAGFYRGSLRLSYIACCLDDAVLIKGGVIIFSQKCILNDPWEKYYERLNAAYVPVRSCDTPLNGWWVLRPLTSFFFIIIIIKSTRRIKTHPPQLTPPPRLLTYLSFLSSLVAHPNLSLSNNILSIFLACL